jgi:hypothetical protein
MLLLRHRLAIPGVITAAAIAVPAVGTDVRICWLAIRQAGVTAGACRQRQQVRGGVVPDSASGGESIRHAAGGQDQRDRARVEADRWVEQQERCRPGQPGVHLDRLRSRREPGLAGRRLGCSRAVRGRQVSGAGRRKSRA